LWFFDKIIYNQRVLRIICLLRHLPKAFRILLKGKQVYSRINGKRFGQLLLTTDALALSQEKNETLFFDEPVANRYLLKKWSEILTVDQGAWVLHYLSRRIPFFKVEVKKTYVDGYRGLNPYRKKPFISFTHSEYVEGWRHLEKRGIDKNDKIVCIHARDEQYMSQRHPNEDHGFRSARNTDANVLVKTINFLLDEGYKVIRMGVASEKEIPLGKKGYWDYSKHGRTEFLDLFIISQCQFLIGTGSGVTCCGIVMRRPILFFDYFPVYTSCVYGDSVITVPKIPTKDGKPMKWADWPVSIDGKIIPSQDLSSNGIALRRCDQDELLSYVAEFVSPFGVKTCSLPNGVGGRVLLPQQFLERHREIFTKDQLADG
jgi:putative glycosyltransferase (TIGR04372 family)